MKVSNIQLLFLKRFSFLKIIRSKLRKQASLVGLPLLYLVSLNMWSPFWVTVLALRLSSGFECRNSKEWLIVFDKVIGAEPKQILHFRLEAFYRAWCLGDIARAMGYQDRFREQQFLRRNQLGLQKERISVSKTIFTANSNTQAYLDTHLKAMALGLRPKSKILVVVPSNGVVENPEMVRLWQDYVEVQVSSPEVTANNHLDLYEEDFTVSVPINGRSVYIEHAKAIVQSEWERQKRPPLLSLDREFIQDRRLEMARIGLDINQPFVSLHVRDNGSKTGSWENSGPEDFRNADVTTYLEAIESLIELGFIVVRVGDPAMKPLPTLPGLIDYNRSEIRSKQLDLFLFTQCKFFIGTSSGPILSPMLFGTPTVGANFAPVSGRLHVRNSLILPKRLKDSGGIYMSFEDALKSNLSQDYSGAALEESEWHYEENSPEEIAEASLEMVRILEGRAAYSDHDEKLQSRINSLFESLSPYGSQGRVAAEYLRISEKLGMI